MRAPLVELHRAAAAVDRSARARTYSFVFFEQKLRVVFDCEVALIEAAVRLGVAAISRLCCGGRRRAAAATAAAATRRHRRHVVAGGGAREIGIGGVDRVVARIGRHRARNRRLAACSRSLRGRACQRARAPPTHDFLQIDFFHSGGDMRS